MKHSPQQELSPAVPGFQSPVSRTQPPVSRLQSPVSRRAALFLSAFLSGCGAAAVQENATTTYSSSEMVIIAPNTLPQREFRSFLNTLRSRSGNYHVELSGLEGVLGDWTFRRTDYSERGRFSFYDLFLTSQLVRSGQPDRAEMLYQGTTESPYFNIPAEHTPNVGSDVFVVVLPGRIAFNFRNPITGEPERRVFEFDENEIGPGSILVADYDAEQSKILIHFASESRITTIVFDLMSAEISLRHIAPEE
ncbi:MAG: hypothetical protein AB1657_00980 [Candidatus Micrarchaeota archaeon]